MAVTKELSRFVRDALSAGQSRAEITTVLAQSGWSASEVEDALRGWADVPNAVPVPRPQTTVSARDFFIYTLTFGLLLFLSIYLVQLLHALIDLAADDSNYRTTRTIRWAMAVLIVTLPVYLWLTIRDRRAVASDPALHRSVVRKWLTYITLLASSAVLLGDLVYVFNGFLSGDLTVQFLAKGVVVAIVAIGIFLYYLSDIRKGDAA